jgi:hypothetical protein
MTDLDPASWFVDFNDENNTSLLDGLMRKLREAKDAPKKFYSSYPKTWSGLDDAKKRKVKEYWLSLPTTFRQGILESVREERSLEPTASARHLQTTKNDKCRLLHLRADNRLFGLWRRAATPFTRAELDARNTDAAQHDSGWSDLAAAFNDYDTYSYSNATLVYEGTSIFHNSR